MLVVDVVVLEIYILPAPSNHRQKWIALDNDSTKYCGAIIILSEHYASCCL